MKKIKRKRRNQGKEDGKKTKKYNAKNQKEIKKKEGIQRFMMKECSTCWNGFESGER